MHQEPNDYAGDKLRAKERTLVQWLRARGSTLIGFSGGVDSAYLACVAVDALGSANVLAVIGKSASYPEAQWAAARDVARRFVPVPRPGMSGVDVLDQKGQAGSSERGIHARVRAT